MLIRSSLGGRDLLRSEALSGRSQSFAIGSIAQTHCDRAISIRGPQSSSHLGDAWTSLERPIFIKVASSIGRPGRLAEELHDRSPIELRSRRDRGSLVMESSPRALNGIHRGLRSRFAHDRGLIGARSWCFLDAKWKLNCYGIEATIYANGIAPSTPSNRSHDHFNCPRSSG